MTGIGLPLASRGGRDATLAAADGRARGRLPTRLPRAMLRPLSAPPRLRVRAKAGGRGPARYDSSAATGCGAASAAAADTAAPGERAKLLAP